MALHFRIKKSLRVLLASEDGFLYMYNLDVNEGGDCQLIRQFRLTDLTPDLAKQEQQNLEKDSNLPPPPQNLQRGGPVDIPDGKTQPRPEGKVPFRFFSFACLTVFCFVQLTLYILLP